LPEFLRPLDWTQKTFRNMSSLPSARRWDIPRSWK
jgi:hypothetical protein